MHNQLDPVEQYSLAAPDSDYYMSAKEENP